MTEEGLNAALLRLQSLTIETYGRIKDIYKRPQQDNDVDQIASLSMKLANYEGALLTLQQYKSDIIESSKIVEEETEEEPEEQEQDEPEAKSGLTEEDLMVRSATYRKSMKGKNKNESKAKKKPE
jgi:hypothetical protein